MFKFFTTITIILLSHISFSSVKSTRSAAFEVNSSKEVQQTAKNFINLYDLANRKGYQNKHITKTLIKDLAKFPIFQPYRIWPQNIQDIYKTKSASAVKITCNRIKNEKIDHYITKKLSENSYLHCLNHYLEILSKNPTHDVDKEYFSSVVQTLYSNNRAQSISDFLKNIKFHKKAFSTYSDLVIDTFKNFKSSVPLFIVTHLHMSPETTQKLQELSLFESKENYYLKKELRSQADHILELIDSNKDFKSKLSEYHLNYKKLKPLMPHYYADLYLLSFGKSLTRRKEYTEAIKVLNYISKSSPHYNESLFEVAWIHSEKNDFDDAAEVIEDKISEENLLKDSRLSYWYATYLESDGNKRKAHKFLEKLIAANPLSYYAILASKKLNKKKEKNSVNEYWKHARQADRDIAQDLIELNQGSIHRIALWAQYNLPEFVDFELDHLRELKVQLNPYIFTAAQAYNKFDHHLEAFKIVYRSLDAKEIEISKEYLEILFPTPFYRIVKSKADFDPVVALALIRQESGFNKRAVSSAGARGLMQLMPATARQIYRRVRTRSLYNPKTNISIGTRFFQKLLKKYDNNLVYSLAAYNAGPHRVKEWQEKYFDDNSLIRNIEKIPYNETRKYVRLIYRNIFFYKMLHSGENVKDPKELNKVFDILIGLNETPANLRQI